MTLRFVALDLGNVLCDLSTHAFGESLAAATGTSLALVQAAFDEATWHAMEVGDLPASAFRTAVLERLGASLDDDTFDACWNRIPTARGGADALVTRLKLPHAIWSNTDPIHAAHLTRTLRCMDTAVHLNLSHLARARKPDRAFYDRGLTALCARAEEVLFIDDRPENRQSADALGIRVEEALTLAQLEAALVKHGVL